jgi:hypothetical protein
MSEQSGSVPRMPLLLRIGMVWCLLCVVLGAIALVLKAAGILAGLGSASGSELVEGFRDGTYLAALLVVMIGVIGWGLWQRRWWTRPAIMGLWLTGLTASIVEGLTGQSSKAETCGAVAMGLLSAGVVGLYLYRKNNVKAYYAALEAESAGEVPHRVA